MAITEQWQNLTHGHYKVGTMCILLHTFSIVVRLCVPISGEFPPSSA